MDILTSHKEIVEKYIILIEKLQTEYVVIKKELNKNIIGLTESCLQNQTEETEFPNEYFEKLTKLKLDFKEIEKKELEEKSNLMNNYSQEICKEENIFTSFLQDNSWLSSIKKVNTECNNKIKYKKKIVKKKIVKKMNSEEYLLYWKVNDKENLLAQGYKECTRGDRRRVLHLNCKCTQ